MIRSCFKLQKNLLKTNLDREVLVRRDRVEVLGRDELAARHDGLRDNDAHRCC